MLRGMLTIPNTYLCNIDNSTKSCFQVKDNNFEMVIVKGHVQGVSSVVAGVSNGPAPLCRFVNIELCDVKPGCGVNNCLGTVLLENPIGDFPIPVQELERQVWHISEVCLVSFLGLIYSSILFKLLI